MFSISFLDDICNKESFGEEAIYGVIAINSFQENFLSPTSYWCKMDYEKQWMHAIHQVLIGVNSSCLITSMYDPKIAEFIQCWILYREGKVVFIQNQILFMEETFGEFDPWNPQLFIPPHETQTEEGECISEWNISIKDLNSFMNRHNLEYLD